MTKRSSARRQCKSRSFVVRAFGIYPLARLLVEVFPALAANCRILERVNLMRWQSRLWHQLRWKLVHGSKFPKANLPSCLLNLASRGLQPRQIIDVGANRGKWSRDASHVFPDAGYTLIEPQIEMESRLQKFCAGHVNRRYLLGRRRFVQRRTSLHRCPGYGIEHLCRQRYRSCSTGTSAAYCPVGND